jgi:hypothetical protein
MAISAMAGIFHCRPPQSLGMERLEETAPTEAVGCTIEGGVEARTEILVNKLL